MGKMLILFEERRFDCHCCRMLVMYLHRAGKKLPQVGWDKTQNLGNFDL